MPTKGWHRRKANRERRERKANHARNRAVAAEIMIPKYLPSLRGNPFHSLAHALDAAKGQPVRVIVSYDATRFYTSAEVDGDSCATVIKRQLGSTKVTVMVDKVRERGDRRTVILLVRKVSTEPLLEHRSAYASW